MQPLNPRPLIFLGLLLGAGTMLSAAASGSTARESLGVFGRWGAFREGAVRCYAIAEPATGQKPQDVNRRPFASIGHWPAQRVRGQVHIRLSRARAPSPAASLSIGTRRFPLIGTGADAWAADRRGDAAIIAAIRSGTSMSVQALGMDGRPFADVYALRGAATAIDAAAIGCARK